MKLAALSFAVVLFGPVTGAAETRYGSLIHDDRIPASLFLTGEIRQGDSFELREALRDHEIRMVIMGSAGGNLYEGLQMGSILRDKGIFTYVPPGLNCESSCANMFFGGSSRKAEGQLGVHQFYSSDGDRIAPLGVAEATAQYTMADVIGVMNELGTPPFVYEKMLGTTRMHYFNEEEMRRLDLHSDEAEFLELQAESRRFISDNPEIVERPRSDFADRTTEAVAPHYPRFDEPSAPSAPPPGRGPSKRFDNTDFFGADLDPKGIRGIPVSECEKVCRDNKNCAAWSYVHATRWCWPKTGVSNISFGDGITSGVINWTEVDQRIFDRPFLEATATDLPGNDVLPRGMRDTTLNECRTVCQELISCRAFTWVGEKNLCFPKYAVGTVVDLPGAFSGVKH